jgi:hypothetical protein
MSSLITLILGGVARGLRARSQSQARTCRLCGDRAIALTSCCAKALCPAHARRYEAGEVRCGCNGRG